MQRMQLEFVDRVAVLKFDHPEVMNAVGGQMLRDFGEAIGEIKSRGTDIRCLLLGGNGRAFCGAPIYRTMKRAKGRKRQVVLCAMATIR